MRRLLSFLRGRSGSSAVEFALVVPIFLFLSIGAAYFAYLMFAVVSLHQATEAAARYASIQIAANGGTAPAALSGSSTTSGSVLYYATNHYLGPGIGATFVYSPSTGCGNTVTASGTFVLVGGVNNASIPLSAAACFP